MEDSIVDGPGLRTAIFAQGCPRRCEGCHNPESWAFGTGTDMTVQDLFWRVKKNPLVRGVTFPAASRSARRSLLLNWQSC